MEPLRRRLHIVYFIRDFPYTIYNKRRLEDSGGLYMDRLWLGEPHVPPAVEGTCFGRVEQRRVLQLRSIDDAPDV
jgi:hypothetical protein